MQHPLIEHRLALAGLLIGFGLVIQVITFFWIHPLAFMAFILLACPLVALGIIIYLYSLVSAQSAPEKPETPPSPSQM